MSSHKSDINNGFRIIFIKTYIIKGIIKMYTKNTHFITDKNVELIVN